MYDVIIIGAGPAGISASLYIQRAGKKALVIYSSKSSLEQTKRIENYYGFENGVDGTTLYTTGMKQAQNLGVLLKNEEVIQIEYLKDGFQVVTDKDKYETRTIILATGIKKNKPQIKGIHEFEGKGISYCAICDGFFYKDKNVSVLGSGKYAISEVNDLIPIAKNITILTNGEKAPEMRAQNVNVCTRKIKAFQGKNKIEEITFEDNTSMKTDGIFIAQGVAGSLEFSKKLGIMTNRDNIIVNEKMETNIKGIFACGDCTGGLLQISKAVYEGTKAGLEVISYLRNRSQS